MRASIKRFYKRTIGSIPRKLMQRRVIRQSIKDMKEEIVRLQLNNVYLETVAIPSQEGKAERDALQKQININLNTIDHRKQFISMVRNNQINLG